MKRGLWLSAYLINHLRIPGGVPNEAGLSYLEQVESTSRHVAAGGWLRVTSESLKERGRGRWS